jgi:hypothetical protein
LAQAELAQQRRMRGKEMILFSAQLLLLAVAKEKRQQMESQAGLDQEHQHQAFHILVVLEQQIKVMQEEIII